MQKTQKWHSHFCVGIFTVAAAQSAEWPQRRDACRLPRKAWQRRWSCARVGVEVAKAAGMIPEHSPVPPRHAEDGGSTTSVGRCRRRAEGARNLWVLACFVSTRNGSRQRWSRTERRAPHRGLFSPDGALGGLGCDYFLAKTERPPDPRTPVLTLVVFITQQQQTYMLHRARTRTRGARTRRRELYTYVHTNRQHHQ
jgi:hypothetical protein